MTKKTPLINVSNYYLVDIKMHQYFANLPKWRSALYHYNNKPPKPVTLPDHSREACHKALADIYKNYIDNKIEGNDYSKSE